MVRASFRRSEAEKVAGSIPVWSWQLSPIKRALKRGCRTRCDHFYINCIGRLSQRERNVARVLFRLVVHFVVSFFLFPGTREAAFVYAIASSCVSYSVTKSCSSGELRSCSCDRSLHGSTKEGWRWAGCSDNVRFGTNFSESFLDAKVRERRHFSWPRILMNLHNNGVGRKVWWR